MADSPDADMRDEYDFRSLPGVVRGKYTAAYQAQVRVIRLADDIADAFATEDAVNEALRIYLKDHPTLP